MAGTHCSKLTRYSDETVDTVKQWLAAAGIPLERVSTAQGGNWLQFDATVDEAEGLLNAKYHVYEHSSGQPHVACDEYSLPSHLKEHIDFVTPSVHFDSKLTGGSAYNGLKKNKRSVADSVGRPGSGSLPKLGSDHGFGKNSIIKQLQQCDEQIVPNCLRALYEYVKP